MAQYTQYKQPEVLKEKNFIGLIPIFKHFSEKSSVFLMSIKPTDGGLCISLAPSTLAGTSGKQSVVKKGTKIYDYSKEVCTNLTAAETIQIRNYLKEKLDFNSANSNTEIEDLKKKVSKIDEKMDVMICSMGSVLSYLSSKDQSYSTIAQYVNNYYNTIVSEKSELGSVKNEIPTQNYPNKSNYNNNSSQQQSYGITIYRKTETQNKMWNFNLSTAADGKKLLYVSVTQNNDKASKIYIALGEAALVPFYNAIDSYINNMSVIYELSNIFDYVDNELQLLKVCDFRSFITETYGVNLERCQSNEDRNLMNNILQGISEAVMKAVFSSRNLRKYTGASYHNRQPSNDE